jgi:hypothetical protein
MLPSALINDVGTRVVCFRSSIAHPAYTPVYASLCTSRYPVQDSGPSRSLVLSRKNFPFSASSRLSGKAMARTGLRMMPTFPSPPLKFRTPGFPQYGFKAGISDKAFPKKKNRVCLRPSCPLLSPCTPCPVSGTMRNSAPPCERTHPLYPRGPRSGPGFAVPVHHHLVGPIRPTRGHISTSPPRDLYEMPSLCLFA